MRSGTAVPEETRVKFLPDQCVGRLAGALKASIISNTSSFSLFFLFSKRHGSPVAARQMNIVHGLALVGFTFRDSPGCREHAGGRSSHACLPWPTVDVEDGRPGTAVGSDWRGRRLCMAGPGGPKE